MRIIEKVLIFKNHIPLLLLYLRWWHYIVLRKVFVHYLNHLVDKIRHNFLKVK